MKALIGEGKLRKNSAISRSLKMNQSRGNHLFGQRLVDFCNNQRAETDANLRKTVSRSTIGQRHSDNKKETGIAPSLLILQHFLAEKLDDMDQRFVDSYLAEYTDIMMFYQLYKDWRVSGLVCECQCLGDAS